MKIHCIKHVPFEGPGAIADWAEEQGHEMVFYKAYLDQEFPDPEQCEFVVVMGGPMNVYEEEAHPWLRAEKKFLKAAVEAGSRVLGICLGAQLLSVVLGGRVERGDHPEVGFYPVEKTPGAEKSALFRPFPEVFTVLHWHGDVMSVPEGALRCAQSLNCANQAFVYDERVVALQFHLETTGESFRALMENCPGDMAQDSPCVQAGEEILERLDHLETMHGLLFGLLDRMMRPTEGEKRRAE